MQVLAASLALATTATARAGTWMPTGAMTAARGSHTATLLLDGRVLIAGGYDNATRVEPRWGELYDPRTGAFTRTAGSTVARRLYHTATLLPSGRVLLLGGGPVDATGTAELFDPSSGTFVATGPPAMAHFAHAAVRLVSGLVLVVGTYPESSFAEVYDETRGVFAAVGPMVMQRIVATATLLPSGRVLVAGGVAFGGAASALSSAELFDPIAGTFSLTGEMVLARTSHEAAQLPGGRVLLVGGGLFGTQAGTAEIFDEASGTFTLAAAPINPRIDGHAMASLPSGNVLLVAGGGSNRDRAEEYDTAVAAFLPEPPMSVARYAPTATRLASGRVLVAGGYVTPGPGALATAELYIPDPDPVDGGVDAVPSDDRVIRDGATDVATDAMVGSDGNPDRPSVDRPSDADRVVGDSDATDRRDVQEGGCRCVAAATPFSRGATGACVMCLWWLITTMTIRRRSVVRAVRADPREIA